MDELWEEMVEELGSGAKEVPEFAALWADLYWATGVRGEARDVNKAGIRYILEWLQDSGSRRREALLDKLWEGMIEALAEEALSSQLAEWVSWAAYMNRATGVKGKAMVSNKPGMQYVLQIVRDLDAKRGEEVLDKLSENMIESLAKHALSSQGAEWSELWVDLYRAIGVRGKARGLAERALMDNVLYTGRDTVVAQKVRAFVRSFGGEV